MDVELIASTQSHIRHETENRCLTADELIAYVARVSNPGNQHNHATAPRLLAYCIKHGHWSVFETAGMTVGITTSRAIAAQLLRHRSFTFQEFSQRYAVATSLEPIETRTQDTKNRQGSGEPFDPVIMLDSDTPMSAATAINFTLWNSVSVYEKLIAAGVSKETARFVLPLATETKLYMTGNVRSWIHYLHQRCADHTQKEHRAIANRIEIIFADVFPNVYAALNPENSE